MALKPLFGYRPVILAVLTTAALTLVGCGVKGAPEPPPGVPPSEIRSPAAEPPPPEGVPPERPFVLDPLLM